MAGIESWFKFETSKQRKKNEKAYMKKMFPFGLEQKEWEHDMLKKLFPEVKDIRQIQYETLVLREKIYNGEHPDDDDDEVISRDITIREWENAKLLTLIDDEKKKKIIALALLEIDSNSFEELPEYEKIISYLEDNNI